MARIILLADDSVTAQNMGRRILTDAGYEVITVNNGSAALKKIAEITPDLIILDVYMPAYGGLEVCQRLKESRNTNSIPVLLTVGKLEPFKVEESRRVRADGHIVKPFVATELLAAITRLEDRIVPRPASAKQGRFAKAMAAAEESVSSSASVPSQAREKDQDSSSGDHKADWKQDLAIPDRPMEQVSDVKDIKPQATGFHDLTRTALRKTETVPTTVTEGTSLSAPKNVPTQVAKAADASAFQDKKDAGTPSVITTQEAQPPEINVSSRTASPTVPAKSVVETPIVKEVARVPGADTGSKVPELKLPESTRKAEPQADTAPKGEAKAEAKPNAETKAETKSAIPPAPAIAAQMPEPAKSTVQDGTHARPETKGVPEAKTATDAKAASETKLASVGKAVPDATSSSTESKAQSEVSSSAEAKKSSKTKSQSSAQTDSEKRIQGGPKKESENKAQPETAAGPEITSKPVAVSDREKSKREEEVNAALASLSPIFENLEATVDKIIAAGMPNAGPGMATSAATAKTKSIGPRWIAECVPLSDGESHLLLESEMEKAYAVVDTERREESGVQAVAKIEAVTAATPVSEVSASTIQEAAVTEKANDASVTKEMPAPQPEKLPAATIEVISAEATSSVITAPEVSAATSIPEMPAEVISVGASQQIPDRAIPETPVPVISTSPGPTPPVEVKSPPSSESADVTATTSRADVQAPAVAANQNVSEGYREIALAAAASAGSTFIDLVKTDPAKDTTAADQSVQPFEMGIDSSVPVEARAVEHFVSEPSFVPASPQTSTFDTIDAPASLPEIPVQIEDAENQSRLAAAWQNWRQIRESIVGDQGASAAPATGFKEIREKTEPEIAKSEIVESAIIPAAESRIPDAEQVAAAEESALASIVDSVLAEMKPRLMAEIARKLGKEPK